MTFVHKHYELDPGELVQVAGNTRSRIAPAPGSGTDPRLIRSNYARLILQAENSGLWIGSNDGVTTDNGFELPANEPYLVVLPPGDELWVIAVGTGPTRTLQAMATF